MATKIPVASSWLMLPVIESVTLTPVTFSSPWMAVIWLL